MTTHHEPRTIDIDAVISHVTRQMTEAAPAADIRARVLSRIDDRPSRGGWRWLPLLALAASLVIVVAGWALWPRAPRAEVPSLTTVAAAVKPAAEAAPPRPNTTPNAAARVRQVQAASQSVPEPMSEAERGWNERAVPALPSPTALALAPIEHTGVTIAPMDIQPLVTEPLTIKSIGAGREILK